MSITRRSGYCSRNLGQPYSRAEARSGVHAGSCAAGNRSDRFGITLTMTSDSELRDKVRDLREGRIGAEDLFELIRDIGRSNFLEAEADVAGLLQHVDAQLRYGAIYVLAFDWDLIRYRGEIERLLDDRVDYVRQQAAAGLGYLLRESRDSAATQILLHRFRDVSEDESVREAAYEALLDIWLPYVERAPTVAKIKRGLPELSRKIAKSLDLSRELGRAEKSGNLREAERIREELKRFAKDWDESWQHRVDWEAVAAIERGEPPKP